MEIYLKLLFVSLMGGIFALMVKKHSPEISILVSVAVIMVCFTAAIKIAAQVKSHIQSSDILTCFPQDLFMPLLKCVAISAITQISVALCKDTGQSALACTLELTGSIVLILCMIPLIDTLFQLIGGII